MWAEICWRRYLQLPTDCSPVSHYIKVWTTALAHNIKWASRSKNLVDVWAQYSRALWNEICGQFRNVSWTGLKSNLRSLKKIYGSMEMKSVDCSGMKSADNSEKIWSGQLWNETCGQFWDQSCGLFWNEIVSTSASTCPNVHQTVVFALALHYTITGITFI